MRPPGKPRRTRSARTRPPTTTSTSTRNKSGPKTKAGCYWISARIVTALFKEAKRAVPLGPGIRLAALKSTMQSKKGLKTSGVDFNSKRGTNFLLWNYKNVEFSVHRYRFISLLYIEHSTGIQTGDLCVYRFNEPTLQPKNISKENYSLNSLTPLPTWATKFLSLPFNF